MQILIQTHHLPFKEVTYSSHGAHYPQGPNPNAKDTNKGTNKSKTRNGKT